MKGWKPYVGWGGVAIGLPLLLVMRVVGEHIKTNAIVNNSVLSVIAIIVGAALLIGIIVWSFSQDRARRERQS